MGFREASVAGGRRTSNISHLLNDEEYAKRLKDIRVRDEQDLAPVDVFSGRVQGASAPVIPIETVDVRAAAATRAEDPDN